MNTFQVIGIILTVICVESIVFDAVKQDKRDRDKLKDE